MKPKILFLGYDEAETNLIENLRQNNCQVEHSRYEISDGDYDLIISYGYDRVIGKELLESAKAPIINLHISYLPFNKCKHPNFWSVFEGTPAGVTIHLVDKGIDTGPILFQRKVHFCETEVTFRQTYMRLRFEIEFLFMKNLDKILLRQWNPKPQQSKGTMHFANELPKQFRGWDSKITDEIARLKAIELQNDAIRSS